MGQVNDSTFRHAGRTAVISGASRGIGQAIACRLAREGANVVIADVTPAEETVAAIAESRGEALAIRCDVSKAEDVKALGATATDRYGGVDILVHNAGVWSFTPFEEIDFDEWRRVMSVNLDGSYHLFREFLPHMREQGWGRIAALASGLFHMGKGGCVHYTASKGGVIGLVRALAAEVGEAGITVNAVAPSLVNTPGVREGPQAELGMIEGAIAAQAIKRTEQPDDVAAAISFLVSEDAGFITGQTLLVDGGMARA